MFTVNRACLSNLPQFKIRAGPSGIHIFDRATGLNVLLDEIQVSSDTWARAPRHVSIALTNACDLSCRHCFVPKKSSELDFERVKKWLKELDENGCLGIGFGGGEPTLYPDLPGLCRYATQDTSLAVTLTTHAHNFDAKLVDELTGNVHFVRVSMDGIGATYEFLRGASFSDFLRYLEFVRSVSPFGINYLVNSQTLPELDLAIRLATEVGAVELLLLPEQPVHGIGGIDDQTTKALRRWVDQYDGPVPLTISEVGSDGLPTCNPFASENGSSAYLHIDASGVLKRSSFDSHGIAIDDNGILHACDLLTYEEVTP